MPRLNFSVNPSYASSLSVVEMDSFGRAVRRVKTVIASDDRRERPILLRPLFLKLMGCLVVLAALAMALALWRLFHFVR